MVYRPPFYKQLFHSSRRFLAKRWLSLMPALQIALTGSHGKTNTTYVLSKMLTAIGNTVVTDINLDTIYNVPITALKVMPWTRYAIFELGVDHPGEMDFHLQIVKPKVAIVTGIAPVHSDAEHLGSLENIVKEKQKLIAALPKEGYAILNYDDTHVRSMAAFTKAKILWYGTDKNRCNMWVDPKTVKVSLKGTSFSIQGLTLNIDLQTNLIGKHHIYTIMAVYSTLQAISKLTHHVISINQLIKKVRNIQPLPGRMNIENGPLGTLLLNDSLRANPASTKSGLETLSEIDYAQGRKIAVLAEMGELEKPKEEHQKIIEFLKKLKIDFVIAIGNLYPQSSKVLHAKDVFEGAIILKKIINRGDLIYLKGSLYKQVGRVLEPLKSVQ
jgi:UDP-N-acetylmuramoyl-tripeptide--D-alanyl-D-alanine ligase